VPATFPAVRVFSIVAKSDSLIVFFSLLTSVNGAWANAPTLKTAIANINNKNFFII
jgi:hypothetical protein